MTLLRAPDEQIIKKVLPDGKVFVWEGPRLLTDSEGNEWGGEHPGEHKGAFKDATSLWTHKERKQFKDFLRLKRKGDIITMLTRFGTTDANELQTRLTVEAQADPRLTVQTRRGLIKTTVAEQRNFASRFAEPVEKTDTPPKCTYCLKLVTEAPAFFCHGREHKV